MLQCLRRLQRGLLCTLLGLTVLGGCATTGAGNPRDPLEPLNRGIYSFNDGVDRAVLKPLAETYRAVLPQPLRTGISNVFSNLNDIIVALNNLLQGKFHDAVSDAARVAINTTVGILGIFDVATEAGLEKHDEDFGQTLGRWGVGDGPYLVLPFLGPRTLRDTVGLVGDVKADPVTYIDPTRDRNAVLGLRIVQQREALLDASRVMDVAALDPYEFLRDAYLQRRRNLIYDGNPPRDKDDEARAPESPAVSAEAPQEENAPLPSVAEPLAPAEPRADAAPAANVVRVWLPTQP